MRQLLRIAVRLLWREFRSGELNLLLIAVVIAVGSITSVNFLTTRVADAMQRQAGELIAADLLLSSFEPLDPAWPAAGRERGLLTTTLRQFPSVVFAGDASQLASVKAVTPGYPLRGRLKTAIEPYASGEITTTLPATGEAWLDSRLMTALGLSTGASITLGSVSLEVTRVLISEPDYAGDLFSAAPRLLVNDADVERSGLIGPGSRVRYSLLIAGPADALRGYRAWLDDRLRPSDRLEDIRAARPEVKTALERADSFLGLAALVAVMLSGIAIAISAQRYARRHRDSSALMRAFGAESRAILMIVNLQLGLLGIAASLLGAAAGYLAHLTIAGLFAGFINTELPPAHWHAALPGVVSGILLIYAFALPPLYRLKDIPPVSVLRRTDSPPGGIAWPYTGAVTVFLVLILWQASDLHLALLYLAGLGGTLVVLGLAAQLLLVLLEQLRGRAGLTLRIGLTYLVRRRRNTLIESVGFGIGLMVIILLALVRSDILDDWLVSLPENTPNQFLINIQPDQLGELRDFFTREGRDQPVFYPMVRARLSAINGRAVSATDYADPRTQRLATRVFNLSWADGLPTGNQIIAGQWWTAADPQPQLSFDEGLAGDLGIGLGDRLTYYVAGESFEAPITSLRKVDWDTFQPNFFVVMPPSALDAFPATYISSFHLAAQEKDLLNRLLRAFPNLTLIDVEAMINQVRGIMDRVVLVVELVFGFTMLAGLLVMFATVQSTQDERLRDNAIMKTLGAERATLRRIMLVEFLFIGLIASVVATLAANLTAWGIADSLMRMPYRPHLDSTLTGIVAGTLVITTAGLLAFRRFHRIAPATTLRRAA